MLPLTHVLNSTHLVIPFFFVCLVLALFALLLVAYSSVIIIIITHFLSLSHREKKGPKTVSLYYIVQKHMVSSLSYMVDLNNNSS